MNRKAYYTIAASFFLLITAGHALRIFMGWDAMIGTIDVPMWVSWVAVVIAGYLAVRGFSLAHKRRFLWW